MPKFTITKRGQMWVLKQGVVEIIAVGSHEWACREMDHEMWLQNRSQFPGKTLTDSRRRYRKGRLGSHVQNDRMRGGRAQEAVDDGEALVAGALVHPVRADGG